MRISKDTLALCEVIVSHPKVFNESEAFAKAVRKLASDALVSRKNLGELKDLFLASGDKGFFAILARLLDEPKLRSLLKKVDKHWPSQNVSHEQMSKRLIALSGGQTEPFKDPKEQIQKLRALAKELSDTSSLEQAFKVSSKSQDDLSPCIEAMTIAQRKKLLKTCDPGNSAITKAEPHDIVQHLIELLTQQTKPLAKSSAAKPRKTRASSKAHPSNPLESTSMGAKWDGIDRD